MQESMVKQALSRRNLLKVLGVAGLTSLTKTLPLFADAQELASALQLASAVSYYPFKIGNFDAVVLSDGTVSLPPEFFAVNAEPEALAQALSDYYITQENGLVGAQVKPLVVNTGRDIVLMDTGNGFGGRDQGSGKLLESLTAANLKPEDITAILISHAHGDHIAGLLNEDGSFVYPNARYYVPETEWTFWVEGEPDLSGFPADSTDLLRLPPKQFLPPLQERLELFKPGQEIVAGIEAVDASGHTPGMTMFHIKSANESLMFTADLMNHLITVEHPEWSFAADYDKPKAAETRVNMFDRFVADKQLIMAYHFPFPGLGRIAKRSDEFRFVPAEWKF
jgi:glyoxylase-like metal-dependent hydrolase (beta-lactamase superfamily II)